MRIGWPLQETLGNQQGLESGRCGWEVWLTLLSKSGLLLTGLAEPEACGGAECGGDV